MASSGSGTPVHLSGEVFKSMTGCDRVHVPCKAAGPALTDSIGGQVHVLFDKLPSSVGQIKGGRVRALADPRMRERGAELGGRPIAGTPEDFGKVIAAETAQWQKVVNASGAQVE